MENFFYKFLFKLFTNIFMFSFFYLSINFSSFYAQQVSEEDRTGRIAKQFLNESILRQIDGGGNTPAAIHERFFTGQAVGDQFGVAVASAGDVNGDGYDDIIIGANKSDYYGTDAGRAYIFFGGLIMDTQPDVRLQWGIDGDEFGWSVAGAGDFNGDGYDDVIIGARYQDYAGSNAGRAYIFFGGVQMDVTRDVTLTGQNAGDEFGCSVSSAGDVNGDGYADVIVGAKFNDFGGSNAGRAYIYFGSSSPNSNPAPSCTLTGYAADDKFGYSVSTAGDVNGDGYADVIVGAYHNDANGSNAGRAYIFYGGSPIMNTVVDITLTGELPEDRFGYSVSNAGDVNGDGYSDVIVGAVYNNIAGSNAGRAYVFYGTSSMASSITANNANIKLSGKAAGDWFGSSVSSAGDLNGDGYDDILVGAVNNNSFTGAAYVYYCGANVDSVTDIYLRGNLTGENFGISVACAGDINNDGHNDGHNDVICGAYYNDAGGTDAGRAYLYTNSLTGSDIPDEFFTGVASGDNFGRSVSTAGDVNGDGYEDVIIGAPLHDAGSVDVGKAYIFFGGANFDNTADVIMTGEAAADLFGYSVSTAGDVNSDGFDDVIIGARENNAFGSDVGRAYVYFGGVSMDNTSDVMLTGEASTDVFGSCVAAAGDVNGDGYDDVIVGAYGNDAAGNGAGSAYIFLGGSSMNNTPDLIMTGKAAGDHFGNSVSMAGDVNGDGYDDVIVGADGNDAGGSDAGSSYLYCGGSTMDNKADVVFTGLAADDRFGISVSTAGDVNGDGYSDVIVGALLNDAGAVDAGSSYLFLGGSILNNIADVIFTGFAISEWFGISVSTAGDVNSDGYSDVIVGAYGNDAKGFFTGRAYIYFGGASTNNIVDVSLTGAAASDYFGLSVSNSGDVNGDGYSDVIVGAYLNDAGGVDAGRAYLYLSSAPPAKPRIMSVKDVPNDQGGKVRVQWTRSSYDIHGTGRLSEYIVQRSNPPGQTGFIWDYVETIPAIRQPFYSYIAPTLSDSTTNSTGTFFFRIIARGTNLDELWLSSPVSGHSVDNLSPTEVVGFTASVLASDNKLSWKENTETDLKNYYIYRSFSSTIDPDVTTPILITSDTTQLDTSVPPGDSYYFIRAKDIHDNFGPLTEISSPLGLRQITFTALLEGFYSSGSSTMVEDTVTLLLKSISPPYTTMDQAVVQLSSIGAGLPKFRQAANGTSYYLVIKHRNSIETWTKVGQQFINSEMIYDFTTAAGQAYGDNMKQKGTEWCIYGGEIANGDQYIDGDDVTSAFNAQGLSGYVIQDVTGDDYVDGDDVTLIFNNQGAGAITPTILKNIKAVDIKHIKLKNESEKKVERNID